MLQQYCQKVIPWDTPWSMPYSWLSEGLDLTQMVLDIRKQLKITDFILPHNFFSNNIAKKPFPGTPLVQCTTPGCQRGWTSPRLSWTSRIKRKKNYEASPGRCNFVLVSLALTYQQNLCGANCTMLKSPFVSNFQ